jgi:hypothetical protein
MRFAASGVTFAGAMGARASTGGRIPRIRTVLIYSAMVLGNPGQGIGAADLDAVKNWMR